MTMVMNAGTACRMSSHLMRVTLIIISAPTNMSAGPVANTGMLAARDHKCFVNHAISLCQDACHQSVPEQLPVTVRVAALLNWYEDLMRYCSYM